MTIDLEKARAETRGCKHVIHFNNAGSSLMPSAVSDALVDYLRMEERCGGYETAAVQSDALENFYIASAKLLNCHPDEIGFVENATRAWDMAFYSFKFSPGDKILTTLSEYGSNVVAYNQQAQRFGAELVFVPDDEYGRIDIRALANLLDDRVKLISINHIPTGNGMVNPAAEVGKLARAADVPFLLDACQSVGQLALDVEAIGCDVLSGTGRKYLRGPRGTGLLYVRRALLEKLEPPLLDQHAAELTGPHSYTIRNDARRFENWERYFAGQAALGVAIDYAMAWGVENIEARICALAATLRERLAALPSVTVTDTGVERCGLVTFVKDGTSAAQIKDALADHAINVSVAEGSGSLVSFRQRGLDAVVRASVHYYNSKAEIDTLVAQVEEMALGE